MTGHDRDIWSTITETIRRGVKNAPGVTRYREPLIATVPADDVHIIALPGTVDPTHLSPGDLLPGARYVVVFFLPFDPAQVGTNRLSRTVVSREWALAYLETNDRIAEITHQLIRVLAEMGIRAAAEPPTDNFDRDTLVSRWSHKSVAVAAGLGSFGLHHMVITEAGCSGRFGSVVVDVTLPEMKGEMKERCLYFHNGSCRVCIDLCPVHALGVEHKIDKQRCWQRCLGVASQYRELGQAEVCGKCAMGPCAFRSPI